MSSHLAVDIGGTFSDLIFYDDATGEVRVEKGSSTPANPDVGVLSVVSRALSDDRLAQVSHFVHGATVALNALLERKGATVGVITTAGFRDVLELRRGDRRAFNAVLWKPAEALVPRELRHEVRERVLWDGTVDTVLSRDDVELAARELVAAGVTAVAIAFINSYVMPDHELEAEAILRESGFDGEISLSHRVSGEMREYERTSTTVVDAYVKPRVGTYLSSLAARLTEDGFGGECLMTSCAGGAVTFDEAIDRPFETIMSGPVGGAVGAAHLTRALGIPMAVCADVGGTSFDTCLILDGRPEFKYEGLIGDMPLQTRWVDVRSIGAGGGSLAYVDGGGLLRVGPQSAGAEPGPACYGRGGEKPTVTDAAAWLGMLASGHLADDLELAIDASQRALEPLAGALDMSLDETAQGIIRIATANMASAIREITLEQGRDPRDASLIAFGGAGALFGTLLARELDMRSMVVPLHAGNFSAWGLLTQDIARTRARTVVAPLDEEGIGVAAGTMREMFAELEATPEGRGRRSAELEGALDIRYDGQEYTLTIAVDVEEGVVVTPPDEIARRFADAYERVFGHTLDATLQIVTVRTTLRTPLPKIQAKGLEPLAGEHSEGTIEGHSFAAGKRVPFTVVQRAGIEPGAPIDGPAIVLEPTTTTYVDLGFRAVVDDDTGAMLLTDRRMTNGNA